MRSPFRFAAALGGLSAAVALAAPGTAGAEPPARTAVTYDGPTMIAQGRPAALSAVLTGAGPTGIGPRTIRMSLGSQSCDGTTDLFGRATCRTAPVSAGLGALPLRAEFAGDAFSSPSDSSATATVFAFPSEGMFVLGDVTVSDAAGRTVLWWGPDWAKENVLSDGDAPSAFKGFADVVTPKYPGSCGGPWTTRPGNSSKPPESVPPLMAVLVASRITKSGSTISGDTTRIVVVQTDPGYGPAPGHRGTGRIVGTVCIDVPPL